MGEKGIMMFGYVYMLADGQPVTVICRSELEAERSALSLSLSNDADALAFNASLSWIRPA